MDEHEAWVRFACAAIAGHEVPDEIDGLDELVDDIIEVAETVADGMLEAYKERFVEEAPRRARRSGKGGRGRNRGTGGEPSAQD
jgi:hypothetical protein